MNHNIYSNAEFMSLAKKLNNEIKRRGTFRWWDPLVSPTVGQDRTSPLSIPDDGNRVTVDDKTYTINTPSEGSIERTRNIRFPAHKDNPAGGPTSSITGEPDSSASRFDVDEIKNLLVGLAKIQDINLFYGRDETHGIAFRDTTGVEEALLAAQKSELNRLLHESDIEAFKNDPNGGWKDREHPDYPDVEHQVSYPVEDGIYVMPSGETDGEETMTYKGPDKTNFYDDHGAKIIDTKEKTADGQSILISDDNYHPINPFVSPLVNRSWNDQGHDRNEKPTKKEEGGIPSSRFGPNPRNPQQGQPYRSRPVFGGVIGSCQVACTGLCYQSCDNECSESCTTTCWDRCGEACTSSCGNICTGCNTMCYTSCKTKCENSIGYSCLNAGAKTVKIVAVGRKYGSSGEPGSSTWPKNTVSYTTYSCNGCAYTCQFWPNKRTTCWDTACQQLCFTSCKNYCSTSCFGGCVDNPSEEGKYTGGIGRGCTFNCTINCVGICSGICEGECVQTCWHACKMLCYDNCTWTCATNCGSGCEQFCKNGCTGCHDTCSGYCKNQAEATGCVGCGREAGCTATCQHDCNKNCIGWGCRSICGIESAGACEANCRLSCMINTCSAMCSEACSSRCTTCANNCGFSCGPCFKAGTLIETIDGPVPIEDIKVGDMVLTQSGEYHRVYKNFKRTCDDELISVRSIGTPIIYTTKEHPFWVKKYQGYGIKDNKRQQLYSEPEWVEAQNIQQKDRLCLYTPDIGNIEVDSRIAYMVGRWLGDGWVVDEKSHNGKYYPRYTIGCGHHEQEDFELKLHQCNIGFTKHSEETSIKYRIPSGRAKVYYDCINTELISILSKCGKYSYGKFIPNEIYDWDEISLSFLIQGYIDSDGHVCDNGNTFSITSTSKKLTYGISNILRMLGRNPSWGERSYSNDEILIQDRKVKVHKSYTIRSQFVYSNSNIRTFYSVDDNSVWGTMTLKEIPNHPYDVYNISVEKDPTYYADGALVHNCTSKCSVGCGAECNITCTERCQNACDNFCYMSCTDVCGGCSNLCYSCVSKCIGVCSVKCDNGCSMCTNNCGWWCDTSCGRTCFMNCDAFCISSCQGYCITFLQAYTPAPLTGPERLPTAIGYPIPEPSNRAEEQESFRIVDKNGIASPPPKEEKEYLVKIWVDRDKYIHVEVPENKNDQDGYTIYQTTSTGGVFNLDEQTGDIIIIPESVGGIIEQIIPDPSGSLFIFIIYHNPDVEITNDDIWIKFPFGYSIYGPNRDTEGNIAIIIKRSIWDPAVEDKFPPLKIYKENQYG